MSKRRDPNPCNKARRHKSEDHRFPLPYRCCFVAVCLVCICSRGTPNSNDLKTNISKYAEGKFTKNDNLEQRKIFTEFLKYAKMAEFAFEFTQSTNYDTTKFGSGDAFARKQLATDKANSKNIIYGWI